MAFLGSSENLKSCFSKLKCWINLRKHGFIDGLDIGLWDDRKKNKNSPKIEEKGNPLL